jgi:nucleotide-binding universal stress UspA family protein
MTASESLIPIVPLCPIPASECCFSLVADVIARLTGTRLALGGSLTEPMANRRGDMPLCADQTCLLTLPTDPRVQRIARLAREEGAGLVAVAAPGDRTTGWIVGLARAVLDDGIAVLVVPPGDHRAWRPSRVGLGYDGGGPADAALAMTRRILEAGDGDVTRLDIAYVDDSASAAWECDGEVIASRRRAVIEWWLADRIGHVPVHVRPLRRVGDPAVELTEISDGLDLLVIGTRGRAPVRRALTGSVSESLIASARCPLLIVPPRMAAESGGASVRAVA